MLRPDSDQAGAPQGLLLVLIGCMPILGTLLVAPILPAMQRDFAGVAGVNFLVPFVQTAPALVLAIVAPFVGGFASRFGRLRTMLAAMALYVVVAPAPLILGSLPAIIVSRLLVGLAEAGLMTTSTAMIGDLFSGARRDRYLGMQVLASSCSAVLFIFLGGLLGSSSWRTPFIVYLAPVVLLPLAWSMLSEPVEQTAEASEPAVTTFPWGAVLRIVAISFLAGMCMNLMSVMLGFVVDAQGEKRSAVIGVVSALNSAGIVVGSLVFGNRTRLASTRTGAVGAMVLAAAGFLLLSLSSTPAIDALAGIVTGLGCGFYLPWLLSEVNRTLAFSHRVRGVGLWMSSYFLSVVVGPPLAIAAAGGSTALVQRVMPGFAAALIVAALMTVLLLPRRPGGPNEVPAR